MKLSLRLCLALISGRMLLAPLSALPHDNAFPEVDRRAAEIRHLDMPYTFQPYRSREDWLRRAQHLRHQVLMSAGLWPMPDKTPLNAQIFGRIERGDYSVEKIFFESYPGFFVTGNLYRPLGKSGPFPGVLSPHGHWLYGRLENSELGSIPARCINLARQGYVVFSYDMVGYNDSRQVNHRLIGKPLSLWGIGSLGLHLWNSIRSLDFLESLPEVDKERLACTGASGGGTQTFLLTAVDDRIKVSAPVNMISHYMQGGDVCENTANLRLDTNNMEIGALMAPRPMLLVSAAGDWTRDTPRIEFPAIQSIYRLFGAADKVATQQFVSDHNYHQQSREAVYRWFGRWLLGDLDEARYRERSYRVEMPSDLLVFFARELPRQALNETQLIDALIRRSLQQIQSLKPRDAQTLTKFRELMTPALQHALAAEFPALEDVVASPLMPGAGEAVQTFLIGRKQRGDRIPAWLWPSRRKTPLVATLLVHPEGTAGLRKDAAAVLQSLSRQGQLLLSVDVFNTGSAKAERDMSDRFFTTYNRTDDANRVQDILTALAFLKKRPDISRIQLAGFDRAGLWCLLARGLAPELDGTVADVVTFPSEDDGVYLEQLYIPLLRRAGDFKTALTLPPASRLLIHHTGETFQTGWARAAYQIAEKTPHLRIEKERLSHEVVANWLQQARP